LPKFHRYEAIVPFGSELPALENATVSGAVPLVGVADAAATGGWLPVTLMVSDLVAVAPPLSVTVNVTV
jgi:hypothetical protein